MSLKFAMLPPNPSRLRGLRHGEKSIETGRRASLEQTLQSIQQIINRLVGIAQYEAALRKRARFVFANRSPNFSRLDYPAYLRRPARIGQHHLH